MFDDISTSVLEVIYASSDSIRRTFLEECAGADSCAEAREWVQSFKDWEIAEIFAAEITSRKEAAM